MTASPAALLGPRSTERVADGGVGLVAVLDSPHGFAVDGGGLVQGSSARWVLDWWIGADDRWHLPAREPSVRQRNNGCGPVVETAVRVPSGDVTQTVYATVVAGETVAVVEVENQSPVPVALAIALRPITLDGEPGRLSARWLSSTEVVIDGHRLTLPRPANERGFAGDRDLLDDVQQGAGLSWPDDSVATDPTSSFPNGVIMVPVPHRTTFRYCLGPADLAVKVADLPGPDNVARGWNTVVEGGGRFEYPDAGLGRLAGVARARLLLTDDRPPGLDGDLGTVLAALAESGHGDRLATWLPRIVEALLERRRLTPADEAGSARAAGLVDGLARSLVITGDRSAASDALPVLVQLTRQIEPRTARRRPRARADADQTTVDRTHHWCRAAAGLAVLVGWLGQDDAASELRRRVGEYAAVIESGEDDGQPMVITAGGPASTGGPVSHDQLVGWSQQANLVRRWYRPEADIGAGPGSGLVDAAGFWRAARHLLVTELMTDPEPTIELLPAYPTAWRGGPLEVHQAATLYGPLSYAIRWHGARPALLWDASECSARLICPALDPDWSATPGRGETLLAGSAGGLENTPAPGDSFS